MSIDFLIGMTVFVGVVLFAFQFMSSSVIPFTEGAGDDTVKVHSVGDKLYYDTERLSTGEQGVVSLDYFAVQDGASFRKMTETELKDDLSIDDAGRSINVTVLENNPDGENEIVELNLIDDSDERKLGVGPSPPDTGSSIARSTRVGHWEGGNKAVIIRVRMW